VCNSHSHSHSHSLPRAGIGPYHPPSPQINPRTAKERLIGGKFLSVQSAIRKGLLGLRLRHGVGDFSRENNEREKVSGGGGGGNFEVMHALAKGKKRIAGPVPRLSVPFYPASACQLV
jgi:hypothetical protein